ncbi:MAG: DMT family transporter [Puniceicoccaceae bacterium]|nr:MAG: DMT family transporter [Puniceicoccaceae bacterium]
MENPYLLFPLLSAFFYAGSALFLKAASREGAGPVRAMVLVNLAVAAGFLVFYPWSEFPALPARWWPTLGIGLTFALGHLFLVLSFSRGDVSVATPVMGTKVLMVALLSALLATEGPGLSTWLAAVLTTVALVLLVGGRPGGSAVDRRAARLGFGYALATAFCFAVFDVLVQEWSPRLGFGLVAPVGILIGALGSLVLLRFSRSTSFRFPARAWMFLLPGIGLIVAQAMILIWTIGTFGDAAGINVVYASRGIWSIAFVWLLGSAFGDRESLQDPLVVARRLAGAVLMIIGIVLVFR